MTKESKEVVSREKFYENLQERKVTLAKERDSRVLIARTNDTHRVLDIVRAADRGIRIIRANLLIRYSPEDVLPLLKEYSDAVQKLHEATTKICSFAGIPYRPPRTMEITASVGDGKEAKEDKKVDARMEMAYKQG